MKQLYSDLFPFALLVILILVGFIAFWSVMDMVILGASLAVVLIPLHHRISEHTLPEISAADRDLCGFSGRKHHGTFHVPRPFFKRRYTDRIVWYDRNMAE